MLPPYQKDGDMIIDDVGSYCVLRKGFKQYILELSEKNAEIGFISVGAIKNYNDKLQPSIAMLKIFGIYDLFNAEKVLVYKEESKLNYLKKCEVCYYFDDDKKHLDVAAKISDVTEFDSKKIIDWKLFNEQARL